MRRVAICAAAVLLAASFVSAEGEATKYGGGVAMTEATAISALAATPDRFVGKTLRVDGVVEAVCENMGCWMQLKDAASGTSVRIKVDDGVIVFPVSARGKKASAEGVFEKVDSAAEAAHHAAMEKAGTAGDTAAPKAEMKAHVEPAPATYQLKATGALVY